MATLSLLVVVMIVVALAFRARRTSCPAILSEHERQLAELRALAEYRTDPPIQPW